MVNAETSVSCNLFVDSSFKARLLLRFLLSIDLLKVGNHDVAKFVDAVMVVPSPVLTSFRVVEYLGPGIGCKYDIFIILERGEPN